MNAMQPARRLAVPAIVTVIVAGWFALATGTAFAEGVRPRAVPAAAQDLKLTPQGTMKLTVVAARESAQVTMTPEGAMKLTVVAHRTPAARVHAAAARDASHS